jgi:hypothetical protein
MARWRGSAQLKGKMDTEMEAKDRKLERMKISPKNPHISIPIRMGYFLLNFVLFDFHSIDFLNPAIGFFSTI